MEREFLTGLFEAAVAAAAPGVCLPPHLPPPPRGRTVVIGAGKASAAMAACVEAAWPEDRPLSGVVVTRYGHAVPCRRVDILEAAHPVPDEAGAAAARMIQGAVQGLTPDDLVLALISGGASALLPMPAGGLTLAQKQDINRALLRSGASIAEMNCVRKHLSLIKGGRLAAAAAPAPVVSLLISDVPGDDPGVIGSGPTVPDASTRQEALAILSRYDITIPDEARAWLESAASETPKSGDPRLAHARAEIVAAPRLSLRAAAERARAAGVMPLILGDAIEGESREVARVMAGIALSAAAHGEPAAPPCVFLSGGETTVTVRGQGRGGRNAEFLLALAVALDGHPRIAALAGDTDGIDGTEDNAGAVLLPDTAARARESGINLGARLSDNDGYSVFAALGDLVVTGPTLTNVNDFRAILVR